jgi:hypothetical protein
MPGLIRRSDIDEVRARLNLADLVGDYFGTRAERALTDPTGP